MPVYDTFLKTYSTIPTGIHWAVLSAFILIWNFVQQLQWDVIQLFVCNLFWDYFWQFEHFYPLPTSFTFFSSFDNFFFGDWIGSSYGNSIRIQQFPWEFHRHFLIVLFSFFFVFFFFNNSLRNSNNFIWKFIHPFCLLLIWKFLHFFANSQIK